MKKMISLLLMFILICGSLSVPAFATDKNFEALSLPKNAVSPFAPDLLKTASSSADYTSNCGYDRTGTFISPYWSCSVNGEKIDVYSSLTYCEGIGGVLHSYACLWIERDSKVQIALQCSEAIQNAVLLPQKNYSNFNASEHNITFSVDSLGSFTCLINGDDMRYAFTLFVREYIDENAEIAELKSELGEARVLVFDKGYYETESIAVDAYDAVYFKRGSYISAKHLYDVQSDEDAAAITQPKEFLLLNGKSNFIIKGYGALDFTRLDRKERSPMFITNCRSCSVEGLCFINSSSWTLYTYACEGLDISDITQFSYRINSDGINICASNRVSVSDSFIRNGDDSFSVKTTNTSYDAHDIVFDNCIAWSTKARCFGITGEVEKDIYNVTFKNSYVFNRNSIWDNDRISSLVICVECGKGQIDNILFENIDIRYDKGRAFNLAVYGNAVENCNIRNVKLKNINCQSSEKPKISTRINATLLQKICFFINKILSVFGIESDKLSKYCGNNHIDATFENVSVNGITLSNSNYSRLLDIEGSAKISFK